MVAVCAVDVAVLVVAEAVSAVQEAVVVLVAAAVVAVVVRRAAEAVSAAPVVSPGAGAAVAAAVVAIKAPPAVWCGASSTCAYPVSHPALHRSECLDRVWSFKMSGSGLAEPALWMVVWDLFSDFRVALRRLSMYMKICKDGLIENFLASCRHCEPSGCSLSLWAIGLLSNMNLSPASSNNLRHRLASI